MELTTENLEAAVSKFYHSDTDVRAQAHQWLNAAKNSPQAWNFVWDLLLPDKITEVQFFAATTLHTKVEKFLNELSREQIVSLKERLLASVINYSTGPKIVINRLCISLAAFLLQTCPEQWENAIPELLTLFTPSSLPHVPQERLIWVLLEILTVLPEEFSCIHLNQTQKRLVRHELESSMTNILNILENILRNNTDVELTQQCVKCVTSWLSQGVPLTETGNITSLLVGLVFHTHKTHSGICESAVEGLGAMITHPDSYKYPSHLLDVLAKILPLREVISMELLVGPEARDQDLVNNLYSLLISFGETHSRLCLDWVKTSDVGREHVLTLVTSMLQCSGANGKYPTEETHSRLPFGFWYILQDDIIASEPQDYELYMKVIGPFYRDLVTVLMDKAEFYPEPHNLTKEDIELFRCYRQDIADTLMYCYSILHETTLNLVQARLESVQLTKARWQSLETCLFALGAIAENVKLDENKYLMSLFSHLNSLPFQSMSPKVLATALDTVGDYAEWISSHPEALEHVLPLITLGLTVNKTSFNATMSLKNLARDCQYVMKPYAPLILNASQDCLHSGRLKMNENIRLMYSVGRIMSVLPLDEIMKYLNLLVSPYLEQLNTLSREGNTNSTQVKNNILMCLKMIGMLFATLDTRPDIESEMVQPQHCIQPVLLILEKLLPVLKVIAGVWNNDTNVMKSVFALLKHAVTTLLEDSQPVFTDILNIIVVSYQIQPQPAALDLTRQLCLLFGRYEKYECVTQSLIKELCNVSITRVTTSPDSNLSNHTDLLEALFNLLSQIVKKTPRLFTCEDGIDCTVLVQCATATLSIPELPTVKAAASFLVNFITQSREMTSLSNTINMTGEQIVYKLISCICNESPRANIDPLVEVLLALNKKYCDNTSRWLQQAVVNSELCVRSTPQQRQQFVSTVLRERANKRKLQDTVREFCLINRGLIGTEFSSQPVQFF